MKRPLAPEGWEAGGEAIRSLVRMPKPPGPRLAVSVRAALAIGLPLALAAFQALHGG